jgi:hypothetical protein
VYRNLDENPEKRLKVLDDAIADGIIDARSGTLAER